MEEEIYKMNKLFEETGRKYMFMDYNKTPDNKIWIYESPDKGVTVYRREFGSTERELVVRDEDE
tara:strand:- start:1161 stop:1352 length:192 start_codon:yes stop_codon:yes gene_type:complete